LKLQKFKKIQTEYVMMQLTWRSVVHCSSTATRTRETHKHIGDIRSLQLIISVFMQNGASKW